MPWFIKIRINRNKPVLADFKMFLSHAPLYQSYYLDGLRHRIKLAGLRMRDRPASWAEKWTITK
jgi:hypothetical protein